MKKLGLILFTVIIFQTIVNGQSSNQLQKITASDRATNDYYGRAVALSGNYMVVGATLEDEDAMGQNRISAAGSVYIYEKDITTGMWNEAQKIVASDREGGDRFGHVVAISGDYIVIGVPSEDDDLLGQNSMSNAGSAYIFERNGSGVWNEVQKIVASDRNGGDRFGHAVAISGDYIVAGAYQESEDELGGDYMNEAGSAYIFERNGSGVWNEVQKIVASDRAEDDYFAQDVSLSGDYMVLGAFRESHNVLGQDSMSRAGSVYIFERNGSGVWNEVQKIVASDRGENDYFGEAVAIDTNYIIVGASSDSEDAMGNNPLINAGSVYLFERNSNGIWSEVQKIVAMDRGATDYFGESVDISGNYAIVGAEYEYEDATGSNTLMEAGSAYILERNGNGVWIQVEKIVASDRAAEDHFGRAVAISGNIIGVGAPDEDEDIAGNNTMSSAGAVYLFEITLANNIANIKDKLSITVYPNPTATNVIIDWSETNTILPINLIIKSTAGQVVYEKTGLDSGKEVVNIESLATGVYFLTLYTTDGKWTTKLMKK